jgi:hypothetical protein
LLEFQAFIAAIDQPEPGTARLPAAVAQPLGIVPGTSIRHAPC